MRMKQNKKLMIFATLFLCSTFYVLTNCREKKNAFPVKANANSAAEHNTMVEDIPAHEASKDQLTLTGPRDKEIASDSDLRSLQVMTNVMAEAIDPLRSLDQTVATLKSLGLQPEVVVETSESSGDRVDIRTGNPFRGTRHFHSIYLGSAGIPAYLQHMRLEFRPGPNALQEAEKALLKSFKIKDKPVFESDEVVKYRVNDEYTVYAKKLNLEDIKEGSDNAWDESDVGTIIVNVQLDLGDHDDEDEHYDSVEN
jgi:hypothetical protein